MIKVLIVDDDSIARTSIKTMIDWTQNGFEICGEAANGKVAVQILENIVPDIVITDMSMPVMNGVVLIDYIKKHFSSVKTIALSGYDEYEYVRQSMKNGAVDYILKHKLNAEVLLSTLCTARKMIAEDRQENESKCIIKEQIIKSREIIKKEFLRQIVMDGIDDMNEIQQRITALDIEIDTRNLIVVAAEIDDFHFLQERLNVKGIEKLISSFIDISTEILKDMGKAVISNIEDEKFIIIFSLGSMCSKLEIHNYIIAAIDRIKASIKRYLNITASFSISSPIDSIVSLSGCYKEAEKALEDKFYKGKDTILQGKLESKPEDEIFNLNINDEKNIISCLKSIDRKNLQMYIDTLFNKIVLYKMSQRAIRMVCAELINIVNTVARESGIDTKLIYQDDEIPYDEMKKYETISEVELWILKVYEKFLRLMEVSSINPDYAEPTKKAIEFIRKNYRNNISLNDAADYTGVNSSYLSRVFKKDCGRGFNEYLNYVRVEQAKLLIQSGNNKLKDIVKNVGFNNYTYFFKVFKDFIGMTPQEYEEIIKKESALECS